MLTESPVIFSSLTKIWKIGTGVKVPLLAKEIDDVNRKIDVNMIWCLKDELTYIDANTYFEIKTITLFIIVINTMLSCPMTSNQTLWLNWEKVVGPDTQILLHQVQCIIVHILLYYYLLHINYSTYTILIKYHINSKTITDAICWNWKCIYMHISFFLS